MNWPQHIKDYAVFFTNELLDPTPSDDQSLEITLRYYQALADDSATPPEVQELAQKAADAHASLIQARRHTVQALEEFEEAAFTNGPPLGRATVRRPKRYLITGRPTA